MAAPSGSSNGPSNGLTQHLHSDIVGHISTVTQNLALKNSAPLSDSTWQALRRAHRNPLRSVLSAPPADQGKPTQFATAAIQQFAARSGDRDVRPLSVRKRPAHEMMGDVREVADHYNKRQNTDVKERSLSPIIGLRSFNNWIKSILIDRHSRHPAVSLKSDKTPLKVLDLGCGKGGDLRKWLLAAVDEYIGLDLADISIEQAFGRWQALNRGRRFAALFVAMDCFVDSIANHLDPDALRRPFDCVSMQFCMHYAFQTEAKARVMMENVTRFLRPGGTFLGTIPDGNKLLTQLYDLPSETSSFSFGNSVYRVTFDERPSIEELPLYGHRYSFYLQDAVDNVPEYVVHWDHFVELASEYGLRLIFHMNFHDLFEDAAAEEEYKKMLVRMGVVNEQNESELNEEQWEIADLYLAFAFVKE